MLLKSIGGTCNYLVLYLILLCLLGLPVLIFVSFGAGYSVWIAIPESWKEEVLLQYGDGMAPYSLFQLPSMVMDQVYEISLQLALPRTNANYALGNFMASFEILTPQNRSIVSVRKPCLLLTSTFDRIPLISPSLVDLKITFLDAYTPVTSATFNARVELGRRDAWRSIGSGEGRELTVHRAFLVGKIKPQGIRALISRYPMTMTAISSIVFLVVATFTLCIVTFSSVLPSATSTNTQKNTRSDLDGL